MKEKGIDNPTETELDDFVLEFLPKKFHLICGTSIGGIIAIMLTIGIPFSQIKNIFVTERHKIFQKTSLLGKLTSSCYTDEGLKLVTKNLLQNNFANLRLKPEAKEKQIDHLTLSDIDTTIRCGVTTYDIQTAQVEWFSNCDPKTRDISIIDVVLSTTAAPTYFPIHVFTHNNFTYHCVDGGVWGNDPSIYGIFLERILNSLDSSKTYNCICFGTGKAGIDSHHIHRAENEIGWILGKPSIIDVYMMSSSSIAKTMNSLLARTGRAFSIKVEMPLKKFIDLDGTDKSTIEEMENLVKFPPKEYETHLQSAVNLTMLMGIVKI